MLSRDLEQAKAAYLVRDLEHSRRAHDTHQPEQHRQEHGKYIKSVVYGGLDGIITTFAVVAGVAGASLSAGVVLILGLANLVADGLSMAIGDFLSTRAENDYNRAERERETWEVENYPEGEKRELVELYVEKGMSEADAQAVVEILAKSKRTWVDVMMVEELGIIETDESPLANAVATFLSFAVFGAVPLAAYVGSLVIAAMRPITFPLACTLTAMTLFALGSIKARITGRDWLRSGMGVVLVGGVAAAAAYAIGAALAGLA